MKKLTEQRGKESRKESRKESGTVVTGDEEIQNERELKASVIGVYTVLTKLMRFTENDKPARAKANQHTGRCHNRAGK